MIHATTSKSILVAPPGALVNNASVTCAAVDRKTYDYAFYRVILGSTDAALTALKLQESDDNATWTDISGLDYSVAATLPTSAAGNQIYSFDVDLRGRKRYLKPVITVGAGVTNGAYVTVLAELTRAEQTPKDATTRGLGGALSV